MSLLAKPIAIALLVLMLFLSGGYFGWRWKGERDASAATALALSQSRALADQEAKAIAAQNAQDALQQAVEATHDQLTASNLALVASDAKRLQDITAAIRGCALSSAVGHPSQSAKTSAIPASDAAIAQASRDLDAALTNAESAGYADSAELAAILALAPK